MGACSSTRFAAAAIPVARIFETGCLRGKIIGRALQSLFCSDFCRGLSTPQRHLERASLKWRDLLRKCSASPTLRVVLLLWFRCLKVVDATEPALHPYHSGDKSGTADADFQRRSPKIGDGEMKHAALFGGALLVCVCVCVLCRGGGHGGRGDRDGGVGWVHSHHRGVSCWTFSQSVRRLP